MTLKSGTGQACAACKYQRRRCTPECLLAPFFPADNPKMFQNVHRLFGVKNIQNLLKELSPDQKAMAMTSIKYHAKMRDKYPVYGCLVEIQQLTFQIQAAAEELQAVLQHLSFYQRQHQQQEMSQAGVGDEYLSELQLGMAPPGDTICDGAGAGAGAGAQAQPDYGINYLDFKENNNNIVLCQQTYSNSNGDNANSIIINSQLVIPQIPEENNQDYNEMYTFFDHIDDTQSYIGSKEAYESSLDSPLGDSRQLVEQMDENELKSAAACFSLTSVNKR